MPRKRPRDKLGTSQGHPGRLGRFMWKFTFKGQNVRGTDGTDDGTDGTCPRDRRDTNQGVSRQNSSCLLVFFFPPARNFPETTRKGRSANCPFVSASPLGSSVREATRDLTQRTLLCWGRYGTEVRSVLLLPYFITICSNFAALFP